MANSASLCYCTNNTVATKSQKIKVLPCLLSRLSSLVVSCLSVFCVSQVREVAAIPGRDQSTLVSVNSVKRKTRLPNILERQDLVDIVEWKNINN